MYSRATTASSLCFLLFGFYCTDNSADPYKAVEPVLDGCYICLPFLKDVVCPGTFVLFSGGNRFGDHVVGQIITVTKNSVIMLNFFSATSEEDGIAPLNNPHLNNLPEVRSLAVCMLQVAIFYFTSNLYFSHLLHSTDYLNRHFFHCSTRNDHKFVFVFSDYEITPECGSTGD